MAITNNGVAHPFLWVGVSPFSMFKSPNNPPTLMQCKYQKQSKRNKVNKTEIKNKTKVVVGASLSLEKNTIYTVPTMNFYPRNG